MYFQGYFGALNVIFLARQSQIVDGVKFLWWNVYFFARTFQQDITHLKQRPYAKVTTLGS
jgi:hypothetical protein